jgi:glycosyltransferase involved in cell wall biosynthesis
MKPFIVANCLIKNEARWIWYAINSVIDQVDKIMIWDTGSQDQTVEIVKSFSSPKIDFEQVTLSSPEQHTQLRQQMLAKTNSEWLMILDGDEIWWKTNLVKTIELLRTGKQTQAVISPVINLVGDPFHIQPSWMSHYRIHEYIGSYNIRFIRRNIPGLHVAKPHGGQEYRNKQEVPLQLFPREQLLFADFPYLHTTHLPRAGNPALEKHTLKRSLKYKIQLGDPIKDDFIYPEVFYIPRSQTVPSPFFHRSLSYSILGALTEPIRHIKQKLVHTEGY